MELVAIFARNLRFVRTLKGLRQDAVADTAGISRSYLSQVESRKFAVSLRKLEQIAAALGVKPWVLVYEDISEEVVAIASVGARNSKLDPPKSR